MTHQHRVDERTRAHRRAAFLIAAACAAALGACYTEPTPGRAVEVGGSPQVPGLFGGTAGSPQRKGPRDIGAMQRAKFDHQQCDDINDCPFGTFCNDDDTCDYTCDTDAQCRSGMACGDDGQCALSFQRFSDITSTGCQAENHDQQIADLEAIFDGDLTISCHTDGACPCGAYCDTQNFFCQVDCVAGGGTSGNLVCPDDTFTCSNVGRCVSGIAPAPAHELTLDMAPAVASGDTYSAPALVPITVGVDATTAAVKVPNHPAIVTYSFLGVDDPHLPRDPADPPPDPATLPMVKCADGDTLATSCTINGGWLFDTNPDNLHSATRTIWVQLPQTTTHTTWTLQAASQWAVDPFTITASADPVVPAPPIPGHYKGTLSLATTGSPVVAQVDALVTDTNVAVLEPTGMLLPDGHAVFSRDATKVTMLGWLRSGTNAGAPHYDVRVKLGALVQDPVTGHLTFPNSTLTIGETAPSGLTLSLDRTADLDAPTCGAPADCTASGTYCDTSFGRCLPGAGPATGAGIVDATAATATPTVTLPSTLVASWATALAGLRADPVVGGTGIQGVERPYCARYQLDNGANRFDVDATLAGLNPADGYASLDRECNTGVDGTGVDFVQQTFPFAERKTEVVAGAQNGADFVLEDTCNTELGKAPTSTLTYPPASPPKCVDLPRFFLSLEANVVGGVGVPGGDTQQRLVWQILRQWLGLNAYVASTAVRTEAYHDVLDATVTPKAQALVGTVDRMEQNLLVLLDPTVRAQFADGSSIVGVATAPDYRVAPRPIARWSFNQPGSDEIRTGTITDPDQEGNNPMSLSSTDPGYTGGLYLGSSSLESWGISGNVRSAQTSAPVALDDRSFSFVAELNYYPFNNTTINLFEKDAADGHRIWLEATTSDWGQHLDLALKDSDGGIASFSIPWQPGNYGYHSLIGIVADEGSYRAYVAHGRNGVNPVAPVPATSVTGNGPHWGPAGIVHLGVQSPDSNSCTSWDRIVPNDGWDTSTTNWTEHSSQLQYTCQFFAGRVQGCSGTPYTTDPNFCNPFAAAKRTAYVPDIFPNAPDWVVGDFAVDGYTEVLFNGAVPPAHDGAGWTATQVRWDCMLQIWNFPIPATSKKPVCGPSTTNTYIEWDEVSLWSHPLSTDEFNAMVVKYGYNTTNPSLPPKPDTTTQLPGNEQRAGLPVYLVEAANAQLDLLDQYLAADADVIYSQCYNGTVSSERAIAAAKGGENLRVASIVAAEAARLAALADPSATWFPRYQADLKQLAARQNDVALELGRVTSCENTLDISEEDLAIYTGTPPPSGSTSDDRFYASSRFLTGLASEETDSKNGTATVLEGQARDKFVAQRQSAFQTDETGTNEKTDRLSALNVNYEGQLKKYCGSAPGDLTGGHPLLDGFTAGTLNAANCFIKTEDTSDGCAQYDGKTPLADVPDTCVRGLLGEHAIAIKSAAIDAQNAQNALARANAAWSDQDSYCLSLNADVANASKDQKDHNATMDGLNSEMEAAQIFGAISAAVASSGSALVKGGGVGSVLGVAGSIGSGVAGVAEAALTKKIADENEKFQQEMTDLDGDEKTKSCENTDKQQKLTIDAATDAVTKATHDSLAAAFAARDDMNTVEGIAAEGKAQIALENTLDRTPPQFHYWLDQSITDYQRHFAYARRLTYLALRAYEYETQTDPGWRARVLLARTPAQLDGVVQDIKNHTQPVAGGLKTNPITATFSLQQDLMHVQPVLDPTDPTKVIKSANQVFNDTLMNTPVFVGHGANRRFLGYGIRFSIAPSDWNDQDCDERIWRMTPLVTFRGSSLPLSDTTDLYQTNTFGSQICTEAHPVKTTRVRQNANLISGDTAPNFSTPDALYSTSITLDRNKIRGIDDINALPDTDSQLDPGMVGRGLYGDYIFVVPLCDPKASPPCTTGYTIDDIRSVTDVQLRVDFVDATNSSAITITGPATGEGSGGPPATLQGS